MESVNFEDPYQFQYVDLDGDPYKDLALKMSTGTNINYFHYWRYSPKTGVFTSLWKHEEVYFDKSSKKLKSLRKQQSAKSYSFDLEEDGIHPSDH